MQRVTKPSEEKSSRTASRGYKLAARSCIACHRRKVRCDRGVPCTNCTRCEFTCVYPKETPEKRPASLQNVSDRLERVESMLARFCETQLSDRHPPSAINERTEKPEYGGQRESDNRQDVRTNLDQGQSTQRDNMSWEVLLDDGHVVQYVNNPNIKDLLQDEEKMRSTPSPSNHKTPPNLQNNHVTIPTPIPTQAPQTHEQSTLLSSYPTPELALHLWSIYSRNVDPVLKILHKPTTQSAVLSTILDPASATRSMLVLTYAIYYAAITALCHCNSGSVIGSGSSNPIPNLNSQERKTLLSTYKSALDKILLSTTLMNTPDLTSLQALAIYATTLRTHTPTRSVWVLTGLTIRLAQSIGLHRNGTDLHLSPFETELRLRLWWHLCVLDSRAPEDQGFEICLDVGRGLQGQSRPQSQGPGPGPGQGSGLRLPLNVNDDQLFPSMREFPVESVGWTEMSFFLMQTESCRLLSPVLGLGSASAGWGSSDIGEISRKRSLILEREGIVFGRYGITTFPAAYSKPGPNSNGNDLAENVLASIAAQHFMTARKKMEFVLRLREEMATDSTAQAHAQAQQSETNPRRTNTPHSFTLACDAIDSNRLLQSSFSHGYRWLFTTYTQWYALAYILRYLCNAPAHGAGDGDPQIRRAWTLVDDVFPDLGGGEVEQGGIWKCLLRLRQQAMVMRGQGVGEGVDGGNGAGTGSAGNSLRVNLKHHASANDSASISADASRAMDVDFNDFDVPIGDDFSSFSGFATDIPFLPEWNAIMNGCFDEMGSLAE